MTYKIPAPEIGIIMGSDSDLPVMQKTAQVLKKFKISFEMQVISAHRTPKKTFEYAETAIGRGLKIIIAGAGGAAHLPGIVAALTTLPVIGVPILSTHSLQGLDSILSILQMPSGVPVATVALNGGENAGILAVQILAIENVAIRKQLEHEREATQKRILAAKVD